MSSEIHKSTKRQTENIFLMWGLVLLLNLKPEKAWVQFLLLVLRLVHTRTNSNQLAGFSERTGCECWDAPLCYPLALGGGTKSFLMLHNSNSMHVTWDFFYTFVAIIWAFRLPQIWPGFNMSGQAFFVISLARVQSQLFQRRCLEIYFKYIYFRHNLLNLFSMTFIDIFQWL